MAVKTDDTGRRWVEMALIVTGTPEEVWQAVATGPGNSAWFTKATIEEQVGGTIHFDFGSMGESRGEVTTWEPPFRFGYVEREWGEGVPPLATEITVTSRSGGQCVVRMVHSLFASTDKWDDQLEGFENGWPGFFEVLRIYLAHFPGEKGVHVTAMTMTGVAELDAWKRLTAGLDLTTADVGEQRTTPSHPERLVGTVECVNQSSKQRYIVLRLKEPAPGIALVGTFRFENSTNASIGMYYYGDATTQYATRSEAEWERWLGEIFDR